MDGWISFVLLESNIAKIITVYYILCQKKYLYSFDKRLFLFLHLCKHFGNLPAKCLNEWRGYLKLTLIKIRYFLHIQNYNKNALFSIGHLKPIIQFIMSNTGQLDLFILAFMQGFCPQELWKVPSDLFSLHVFPVITCMLSTLYSTLLGKPIVLSRYWFSTFTE